jgi:hypothetical protein
MTVSSKVSLGTLGGGAVGIVSSLLVYYIPAWHSGLPGYVAYILPVLLTLAGHFLSGYMATHKATAAEVDIALAEAEHAVMSAAHLAAVKSATAEHGPEVVPVAAPPG